MFTDAERYEWLERNGYIPDELKGSSIDGLISKKCCPAKWRPWRTKDDIVRSNGMVFVGSGSKEDIDLGIIRETILRLSYVPRFEDRAHFIYWWTCCKPMIENFIMLLIKGMLGDLGCWAAAERLRPMMFIPTFGPNPCSMPCSRS